MLLQVTFDHRASMRLNVLLVDRVYGSLLLLLLASTVQSQVQCPVDIPESERRDCYPWEDLSQAACESRDCVWCESDVPGVPWCYHNDWTCPSLVAERDRVDCLPEGGSRDDCIVKDCVWCETTTADVPKCFYDADVSQGGALCPADILPAERVTCHAEPGVDAASCVARGCYWCNDSTDGAPPCFVPRRQGYRVAGGGVVDTGRGYRVQLERVETQSWYGSEFRDVLLEIEFQTNERIRVKFTHVAESRYEVPLTVESPPEKPASVLYDVTFTENPVFSFQIVRKATGAVIFDTSVGGLRLSDQFLQIATRLDSSTLFGFGEHEHRSLLHNMNWTTWVMYTRDQPTTDSNLYGAQPFYINVERSGSTHGVLFLNSNAQEVQLSPAPALTYRTIGGILDVYVLLGPTPNDVVEQLTQAVGRPLMVPYWSLGFHLCRWGYENVDHMKDAVNRMRQYDIPHDVQYADIDYMNEKRIFTLDTVNFGELPQYVNELKEQGTRFIIIMDPGVYSGDPPGTYPAFDLGNELDVWVKDPDGLPAEGNVWPGDVYFPDFSKDSTQTWWTDQCVNFKTVIDYDALWIDMNEPSNFRHGSPTGCSNTSLNYPPYIPDLGEAACESRDRLCMLIARLMYHGVPRCYPNDWTCPSLVAERVRADCLPDAIADGRMFYKTLCLDRVQTFGVHYNVHSLYGWSMSKQTLHAVRAATGKRSIVFTRSTFPGVTSSAQHWLGDNRSEWDKLRYSLIGIMEFNMFGIPYVGPDICGFIGEVTEELCQRWQQIGAFYTFSRNHNSKGYPDQDPGMWPAVAQATRETLHIRYTLLPFLYTLMHQAHIDGTPVLRPLVFDYPADPNTYPIDQQMQWGSALLLSPVLTEGAVTVQAYFPDARHFSYYTGEEVTARKATLTLDAPLDFIPIHVRGGNILPTQLPANSTVWSRTNPMGLLVALDDSQSASGSLFWDDGETLDTFENGFYYLATFTASAGVLVSEVVVDGFPAVADLSLDDVRVMGITTYVTTVTVNDNAVDTWSQDPGTKQLTISSLNLSLTASFTITWSQ